MTTIEVPAHANLSTRTPPDLLRQAQLKLTTGPPSNENAIMVGGVDDRSRAKLHTPPDLRPVWQGGGEATPGVPRKNAALALDSSKVWARSRAEPRPGQRGSRATK